MTQQNQIHKVNRYTRAGQAGKTITCPCCGKATVVFHFCWIAVQCCSCKQMVNKGDWLLGVTL